MMKAARQRETNHLRAIYRWHPIFAEQPFINYFGNDDRHYDNSTIEGGDVLVIGKGAVLIGMSERTTPQGGVENFAASLFKSGQAKEVIALNLPKHRSCMHLDTVMTHMDIDTFSVYPEIINQNLETWRLSPKNNQEMKVEQKPSYMAAIESALNIDQLKLITLVATAMKRNGNSGMMPTMC